MKASQYIEHLQERIAEYGDHELVDQNDAEIMVPEFNNDIEPPVFCIEI